MKKSEFFSEPFLDECENQLVILYQIIFGVEPFAHPIERNPADKEVAKIFYNRVLFLLYRGHRITKETFIKESFMVGEWKYDINAHMNE